MMINAKEALLQHHQSFSRLTFQTTLFDYSKHIIYHVIIWIQQEVFLFDYTSSGHILSRTRNLNTKINLLALVIIFNTYPTSHFFFKILIFYNV